MKTQKSVIVSAIISILIGAIVFVGMATIYVMFGYHVCTSLVERHPDMGWFILAFKAFSFVLCPALSIQLVWLGIHIIYYFRNEPNKSSTATK